MTTDAIDLNGYLRRIGFAGAATPTVDTLAAIHRLHPAAIPFENLDPLLGRPVHLDLPSLEDKLVRGGRGGYCFEQNLLLSHALTAIGFTVTGLAARVLWNVPDGVITARSHMLLRVEVPGDGTYLADVGFGGQVLTGRLRLVVGVEQETPHEPYRLVDDSRDGDLGAGYLMQTRIAGSWQTMYRFDLQQQFQPDYEVSSHYMSTSPRSHFTTGLVAARAIAGRRFALRNRQLTIHHLGGDSERRILDSVAEVRRVLERDIGIALPAGPELDAALERLA
jgi:N-hydroxyarylamine O-acetyltransferase